MLLQCESERNHIIGFAVDTAGMLNNTGEQSH